MRTAMLTALLLAAPAHAADPDREYYPTAIGSKWTFSLGGQGDKFVWSSVRTEKIGEQECIVFEGTLKSRVVIEFEPASFLAMQASVPTEEVVGREYVAFQKDGIYRYKANDNLITPPICFFKSDAKGQTWKQDFRDGEAATTAKFAAEVEDVEVPAGKFKEAVVIRTEAGPQVKSTIWYAKGVGIVKQSFDLGDVKYDLLLEKYSEPQK